jgi:DNA-binding NtrC family response regulator
VLQDVAALDRKAQAELLRWIDGVHDRKQLVATTLRPLFAPVRRGLFDEALYYRLNVMRLHVGQAAPRP